LRSGGPSEDELAASWPIGFSIHIGIRNFGNFAAHPNENKATLEIIDVEPHEAEW
jgi:hypothetical protein